MDELPLTYRQKKEIYERDGGRCFLCMEDVPFDDFAASQVITLADDLLDDPTRNRATCCAKCFLVRGDTDALEYRIMLSLNGLEWRDRMFKTMYKMPRPKP